VRTITRWRSHKPLTVRAARRVPLSSANGDSDS
jgi:hypothetical protein